MKPIRLSAHVLGYVNKRGFTVAEVEETIRTCRWIPAPKNRWECRMEFSFGKDWNGTLYANKRVRPIFVETTKEIIVVTVYTYYY